MSHSCNKSSTAFIKNVLELQVLTRKEVTYIQGNSEKIHKKQRIWVRGKLMFIIQPFVFKNILTEKCFLFLKLEILKNFKI